MKGFRDPFDDEEPDYPARKSGVGGSKLDLPVIAAEPTRCVHCGGDPEYQHPCEERLVP